MVSLSSMKGKVLLLNFWATWCPPCVAEMPSLNRLYGHLKSRGLEVIAISIDRSADDVKEFLGKKGFNFTILMDQGSSVAKRYRVFSTPTTFLIDKNGNIVERFFGDYDWQDKEIEAKIEKLL
jgi:peroxiredoxin